VFQLWKDQTEEEDWNADTVDGMEYQKPYGPDPVDA